MDDFDLSEKYGLTDEEIEACILMSFENILARILVETPWLYAIIVENLH